MGFEDRIESLVQKVPQLLEHLETEEATKTALVMPFLAALGYDVFNPQEVVPEFTADVGTKKGEKVDYAIKRDGEIILLVECKKAHADLSAANASQLYRYFSVTNARLGMLTNGLKYLLYSDLDQPNVMDSKPFLELDLADPSPGAVRELGRLARDAFDLDQMLGAANELKYTKELKRLIAAQMQDPAEEIVRFFAAKVQSGRFTAAVKEQFTTLVGKAFRELVSDRIRERLRSALDSETRPAPEEPVAEGAEALDDRGIETTEEELDAFRIVRAICCKAVEPRRVAARDTKSYFGVLLDDNNRKPICRLWFNSKQKYLGVFDANKKETRIPIASLSDIYSHSKELLAAIESYGG